MGLSYWDILCHQRKLHSIIINDNNKISDKTNQADVRVKALGILHQMKTFEFIYLQYSC
jgi:hypothetical protein